MCFRLIFASILSLNGVLAASIVYRVETVAGTEPENQPPALTSLLEDVRGLAVDLQGNVFLSDSARHRVYRLTPDGDLHTVAGTGRAGFSGDGGPADQASLDQPYGIALDENGALYIADLGNRRVRRVSRNGLIETIAGGGSTPASSTTQPATSIALRMPRNLAVDPSGIVFISDFADHRILRLQPSGLLDVVAGTGQEGFSSGDTSALAALFRHPAGLCLDSSGALYIADSGNHAIRRLSGGTVSRVPIEASDLFVNLPTAVSRDASGNLLIASTGFDMAVRVAPNGNASVVAVNVRELTIDAGGNLYLAAGANIRRITAGGSAVSLSNGPTRFRGEGANASQALFDEPTDVKLTPDGSLLIADTRNNRIRKVTQGIVTTVAGNGDPTTLNEPAAIAPDGAGNLYIAERGSHRIRQINPDGTLETIAGTGVAGFNQEIGASLETRLNSPSGIAIDRGGNVYFSDTENHRIRRLLPGGYVGTIAGNGGRGFGGDGAGASASRLDTPLGLCFDTQGNLYIADSGNHRIRRILASGVIETVAGNGQAGFSGDGGAATAASLQRPSAVYVDAADNLWISDTGNQRIRRVSPDGTIETVAGNGERGFSGDGDGALSATFSDPAGLTVDAVGAIYVADRLNHRIRKLTPGTAAPPLPITTEASLEARHAASLTEGPIAPGLLLTLQGPGIGPAEPISGRMNSGGSLETWLDGLQVLFDDIAAPILYAQENLINVQVPYEIGARAETVVQVVRDGLSRGGVTLSVQSIAPGIFTTQGGTGPAVALNDDYQLNTPENGAARGSLLTFFATGTGSAGSIQVNIGGLPADVVSLASDATSLGVLQVTVRIPQGIPAGGQPLVLRADGASSQSNVSLFVK